MLILFNNLNNTTEGMPTLSKKQMKKFEGKEIMINPLVILMMKVYVLLFNCYDILALLYFW